MQNSCHLPSSVPTFLYLIFILLLNTSALYAHAGELEPQLATLATTQPSQQTPSYEDTEALKQRIITFYTQIAKQKQFKDIQVRVSNLSPQLRLQKCQTQPTLEDQTLAKTGKVAGRHTLKVSCNHPKWKIYLSTYVTGKVPAIATTKVILKNAVIHSADVKQIWLPAQQARLNRIKSLLTVVGMRAKRNLRANKILTAKDLTPPFWVFNKNEVTLMTRLNGLTVKAKGIALENGVQGQQITVKNKHSGKTLKGIVVAPNTVEIP